MDTNRKQLDPRIYSMADAREVFATLSNPTVQLWAKRKLLSYGREESWQGNIFKFSLPELVHLAVVAELSTFGVFKNLKKVFGYTGLIMDPDTALPLTKPGVIVSYYQAHKYDVGIYVRRYFPGGPVPWRPDKRVKREAVNFALHFMQLSDLQTRFNEWLTGDPSIVTPFTHQSALFISVAAINARVRRQFWA